MENFVGRIASKMRNPFRVEHIQRTLLNGDKHGRPVNIATVCKQVIALETRVYLSDIHGTFARYG